jgi:hypothetical protein
VGGTKARRFRAGCKDGREGQWRDVPFTLLILLAGIAVAALVFVISGGHILFLPLILLFPIGLFFGRRRS